MTTTESIFITGATGCIGHYIVNKLLKESAFHCHLYVRSPEKLKVNYKNLMISVDGVCAAGDIVRGASLVVWGIKDGRDAANHIHNYLENNQENKRAVNE